MPGLDGVRGLAILAVVWHNVVSSRSLIGDDLPTKIYLTAAGGGWAGVTLFFALSGFLITGILRDVQGVQGAWRNFLVRRSLRIFPLYYSLLFTSFVVMPALAYLPPWLVEDHRHQVWYWTYLVNWTNAFGLGGPGFPHFWSLALEEQFYLFWPIAALTLAPRRLATLCGGLVVLALGSRIILMHSDLPRSTINAGIYTFTICRVDALALGALVALAVRDDRWIARLARWAWPTFVALAIATLALGIKGGVLPDGRLMQSVGHLVLGLTSAALVALAALPGSGGPSLTRRMLCSPALRSIGRYSYAIYVLHLPLMRAVQPWPPPSGHSLANMQEIALVTVHSAAILLVSFALALASWWLLERPLLALRPTPLR